MNCGVRQVPSGLRRGVFAGSFAWGYRTVPEGGTMPKRPVVQLTDGQRADLEGRFCGRMTLRERNRVQVLLRSYGGDTDEDIAVALDICTATVVAIRKRFAADGL